MTKFHKYIYTSRCIYILFAYSLIGMYIYPSHIYILHIHIHNHIFTYTCIHVLFNIQINGGLNHGPTKKINKTKI